MSAVYSSKIRNATLLFGSTMTVMAGATVSPALPQIYAAFEGHPQAELMVRLVLTMPALFIGLAAPLMGYLLDVWGRKPVLIASTLLYGIAGSSGFYLSSLEAILIGRAMLGIAVAGIMSGFTTLIGDYFKGPALNRFMGLQGAFMSFGGVAFLLAGGYLADVGWEFPFLVYLCAFLLLPSLIFSVNEPPKHHQDKNDLSDVLPLGSIAAVFFASFLGMAMYYLLPVQIAFFLNSLGKISGTQVGVIMAASTLVTAIASMKYHAISRRLPIKPLFVLVHGVLAVGFLCLGFSTNNVMVLASTFVLGLGFGWWIPNMNVWLMSLVPARARGKVIGGFTMCFFLGQFFSPLLSQPLINYFSIEAAFIAAAVLQSVLAMVFFLQLRR